MEIKQFDDTKMRACLQAVKRCLTDLNKEKDDITKKSMDAVYNGARFEGLPLSESIDFCLDMNNSTQRRNIRFNEIYLKIDTLLTNMQDRVEHILLKTDQADKDAKTAESHIKVADDLLQALVAETFHLTTRGESELRQESQEVSLQRKVEELEIIIKTLERRYSNMEQDRNTINLGYQWVVDQKNKLEAQKEELVHKQANKNAEILTLKGELGSLKREVERLEGEVERLTIQNKHLSKSSSRWSYWKNRSNMQTLLEDLNNFRE